MKRIISVLMCMCFIFACMCNESYCYAETKNGNNVPVNLQVLKGAYDDNSIVLTWENGDDYSDIVDYNVYQDGSFIGSAKDNFASHSDMTNAYMDAFYKKDKSNFHVKAKIMTYKVTDLNPDTTYTFTVKGVLEDGTETEASKEVSQATSSEEKEFNILDYGARDTGKIIDYSSNEEAIKDNTKSIQSAINDCCDGGKVVVPEGTYTTGSIYLKSNMTLELQKGAIISGSTNLDDYDFNKKNNKYWGLVNSDKNGAKLTNVRIIGSGTICGNGWKYSDGSSYSTDIVYQQKDSLDPSGDEYRLPQFAKGANSNAYNAKNESKSLGLLAKDSMKKLMKKGKSKSTAYSLRPSLVIMKNIDNLYMEGITTENPANHNISITNCKNATMDSVNVLTYDCNNGDGVEFDGSQNCNVFGCLFDTGDDSINFAAGMGAKAKGKNPTKDIRIFNNFVRHGHGGAIAAGSHTGAWIENIIAEDNVINKNEIPFRFKSVPTNGGGVRNVIIRDNAVENPQRQAFMFTTKYADKNQVKSVDAADTNAQFNNITVKNVTVNANKDSAVPIEVDCDLQDGHNNINFENVKFNNFSKGCLITGLSDSTFKSIAFTGNKVSKGKQWTLNECSNVNIEK